MFFCGRQAPPVYEFLHAPYGGIVGSNLGGQVATAFMRRANIAKYEIERYVIRLTRLPEFNWWNDDAFLVDFGCYGHRAGRHASNISMMGTVSSKTYQVLFPIALNVYWRNNGDVRKVCSSQVRIV